MDINRLSTDIGVTKMDESRKKELRNLNLLEIPEIKKSLIEREKALGHSEDEINENIKLIATAIKYRTFTDSRDPHVKWLGTELRRLAGNELTLLDYTEIEQSVIFDVSKDTIRRDIKANENFPNRQWWRKPFSPKETHFSITKDWDYYSL